ncbi:hypothetical protein DMJ13_01395 [halophilic archaeon]|nr:hypothetical protein DMJ13_01395 [halophilic archaeon]
MVDERSSPSTGWEEVYDAMDADTDAEGPARPCPDCDAESERVFDRVFRCPDHGFWALGRDGDVRSDNRTGTEA